MDEMDEIASDLADQLRPGRPAKSESEKRKTRIQVPVNAAEKALAEELGARIGSGPAEAMRRGLQLLKAEFEKADAPLDLQLSGDAAVVEKKGRALASFRRLGNVACAAESAGVTSQTIQYWQQTDPIFHQLSVEMQARAVGVVEGQLYDQAMNGNTAACFAILNARHPDYGAIRTQMMQRVLGPFMDRVIESARRFIPDRESLERFALDIGRKAERIALHAAGGRNR